MHTYGENHAFRFVEGIWCHRKSRQIRVLFRKRPYLHHTCATCSKLPPYTCNVVNHKKCIEQASNSKPPFPDLPFLREYELHFLNVHILSMV